MHPARGLEKAVRYLAVLPVTALGCGVIAAPAHAQQPVEATPQAPDEEMSPADALMADVIVTATKRPEDVQDVPLAVTAFGSEQLEALNFRNLEDLGNSMPSVALDENGTVSEG